MNAERRGRVAAVVAKLEEIQSELSMLADEDQEAYDNMPEGLQESERGQAMQEAQGDLEEAADSIRGVIDELGNLG